MRELGDSICHMRRYQQRESMMSKLQTVKLELCCTSPPAKLGSNVPSSLFLLQDTADKIEELVREVDGLGKAASFTNL